MIECEFKCIKEDGSAAEYRIDYEGTIMNVCEFCLASLENMGNVKIIETHLNY